MSEEATFTGSIVLKAASKAEVETLAALLSGFAEWGEPFGNKYEAGDAAWCVKGKVISGATASPGIAAALQDATERGEMERQITMLERALATVQHQFDFQQTHLLAWLTETEKHRALMRSFYLKLPDYDATEHQVLDPMPDAETQRVAIAHAVMEYIAQVIENRGPDDPLVNMNAAGAIARLVRGLAAEGEAK